MAGNLLFYYFGNDEAYFKALQGEFKKSSRSPVEIKRFFETEEAKIQGLFLKIFKDRPHGVFIDFSKHTQDYLHLARIIARTPLEQKLITVGLVDYLSPAEIINESIATGVDLCHIKSPETFDVVFDVQKLASGDSDSSAHGFATGSLKEEWEAGIPCKIGHVNLDGIHFETNYKLTKGSKIILEHYWLEKKIVPSKELFVKEVSSTDMFYQFKYNSDVDFLYVDEVVPFEGMTPEELDQKKTDREELVVYHKRLMKKWLEDNLSSSQEKKAKVLIVDRTFPFYSNQPRTDKYPYTLRSIPFFTDVALDIDRNRPQVIAYSLDANELSEKKNTLEDLMKLTNVLKTKYQDLDPFIVVFNMETPSKELQEKLKYPKIMSYNAELSVEVLVRMADIFEKKMSHLSQLTHDHQSKVFIKKNNSASVAHILIPLTIIKLSESDMIFQSDLPLEEGMNLHIRTPVDMYINIRPIKGQGKIPEYHGLIHSIGEIEKKELRRYVNTIFFRDHDAQVNAETDEFKRLNDAKLQEKLLKIQAEAEKNASDESKDPSKTPEEA